MIITSTAGCRQRIQGIRNHPSASTISKRVRKWNLRLQLLSLQTQISVRLRAPNHSCATQLFPVLLFQLPESHLQQRIGLRPRATPDNALEESDEINVCCVPELSSESYSTSTVGTSNILFFNYNLRWNHSKSSVPPRIFPDSSVTSQMNPTATLLIHA